MAWAPGRIRFAGTLAVALVVCVTAAAAATRKSPRVGLGAQNSGRPAPAAGVVLAAASGACDARLGADRLRRSAIVRAVDAGLGSWLQTVSVDPKLDRGRFKGWIIRSLPPDDPCYAGVDLHADDVVTRVNGRSVEHPEEAHNVWLGLRTSPSLVIEFLRRGEAHTIRFAIVDQ